MAELFLDGSKLLYHLDAVNRWKKGELTIPLHVEVSPAGGCNQRCILCCVDHLGHKPAFLPEGVLLELTRSMSRSGVKSVLLAGEGEPTLNRSIVPMIRLAQTLKLDMALNTNGVPLVPEMSREILAGLSWLRFSFQAGNPADYRKLHGAAEGDFEKVKTNVHAAVEHKRRNKLDVTIGIQQILLPDNIGCIHEVAQLAKELGVDYYVVKRHSKHPKNTYVVPDDLYLQAREELKSVESLQDESFRVIVRWRNFEEDCNRLYNRCLGIQFIAQVLSDGGIYPCSQYFKVPEYCYGYLHEGSFEEIMNSERTRKIQDRIQKETKVDQCMSYCRHHGTNQFLSMLENEPRHVNFI